jgi:hypothetical protein
MNTTLRPTTNITDPDTRHGEVYALRDKLYEIHAQDHVNHQAMRFRNVRGHIMAEGSPRARTPKDFITRQAHNDAHARTLARMEAAQRALDATHMALTSLLSVYVDLREVAFGARRPMGVQVQSSVTDLSAVLGALNATFRLTDPDGKAHENDCQRLIFGIKLDAELAKESAKAMQQKNDDTEDCV